MQNCGKNYLEEVITELNNYLEKKVLQATETSYIRINNWWSKSKKDIKNMTRREYRSRSTAENELIKDTLQSLTKEYKK